MSPVLPASARLRFEFVRPLAAGGFANVFLARQIGLDRQVALKVLRTEDLTGGNERGRFVAEARITAALRHPHIVEILDFETSGDDPWIAYEYLPGRTLEEVLRTGAMPWLDAVTAGVQIAQALQEAHDHGIVHRDVKPENVIEVEAGRYKVTDFGIAKWLGRNQVVTSHGLRLGTPAYMAPEQIRGAETTPLFDVYALGILLHELIAGKPPFHGRDVGAVLRSQLTARPPRLDDVVPGVPSRLARLLDRALAKRPEERIHSAKTMACALERILQAGPDQPGAIRPDAGLTSATVRIPTGAPRPSAGPASGTRVMGSDPARDPGPGLEEDAPAGEDRADPGTGCVGPGPGASLVEAQSGGPGPDKDPAPIRVPTLRQIVQAAVDGLGRVRSRPPGPTRAATASAIGLVALLAIGGGGLVSRGGGPKDPGRSLPGLPDVELPAALASRIEADVERATAGIDGRMRDWIGKLATLANLLGGSVGVEDAYFDQDVMDLKILLECLERIEPFEVRIERGARPSLALAYLRGRIHGHCFAVYRNLKVLRDAAMMSGKEDTVASMDERVRSGLRLTRLPWDLEQRSLKHLVRYLESLPDLLARLAAEPRPDRRAVQVLEDLFDVGRLFGRAQWEGPIQRQGTRCIEVFRSSMEAPSPSSGAPSTVSRLVRALVARWIDGVGAGPAAATDQEIDGLFVELEVHWPALATELEAVRVRVRGDASRPAPPG